MKQALNLLGLNVMVSGEVNTSELISTYEYSILTTTIQQTIDLSQHYTGKFNIFHSHHLLCLPLDVDHGRHNILQKASRALLTNGSTRTHLLWHGSVAD